MSSCDAFVVLGGCPASSLDVTGKGYGAGRAGGKPKKEDNFSQAFCCVTFSKYSINFVSHEILAFTINRAISDSLLHALQLALPSPISSSNPISFQTHQYDPVESVKILVYPDWPARIETDPMEWSHSLLSNVSRVG